MPTPADLHVVEQISHGIQVVDLNGIITYANKAHAEMYGCEVEDLIGRSVAEQIDSSEEREAFPEYLEQLLKERPEPTPYESINRTFDGRKIHVLVDWAYRYDDDGQLIGFISVLTDVTRRVEAEAALRESEQKYRALVETSSDWIWEMDIQGRHLFSNSRVEQVLGYSASVIATEDFFEYFHPDDRDEIGRRFERLVAQKKGWRNWVVRLRHADGTYRCIDSSASPKLNDEGELIGYVGVDRDITERLESEARLRESEERFRQHFTQNPVPIYHWEKVGDDFVLRDYNPAAETVTEGAVKKLLNVTLSVYAEHLPDIREDIWTCFREQRSVRRKMRYDYRYSRKQCDLDVTYVFVPPSTVMVHTENITDRVRAERDVAASRDRLQNILDNMPVMVDAFSGDLKLKLWNKECERVTGYSREEMIDIPNALAMLYPDADALAQMSEAWTEIAGDFRDWECEITCKDGSKRTIAWNSTANQAPIEGWVDWGVGVDVADRKRAVEQIALERQRLRRIMDYSFIFSGLFTPDGCLTYVNEAPLAATGLKQEDVLGVPFWETAWWSYSPEVQVELKQILKRAMTGSMVRETLVAQAAEGQFITVDTHFVPVHDESGKVVEVVAQGVDITEQVAALQELVTLRDRVAHVANVNMLGEVAASITHEMQQPLGAMANTAFSAKLCLKQVEDPKAEPVRQMLDDCQSLALRAGNIVRRFRRMLSPSDYQFEVVSLNDIVSEAVSLCRASLDRQKITLALELEADLPPAYAEPVQLTQVLVNLINNARDALVEMPESTRRIVIRTWRDEKMLAISVRDHGPGIEPELMDKMFEPFFTTKSPRTGMGMGLAICHRIVDRHSGKIEVESQPGEGATFHLRLPIARDDIGESGDLTG